MDNSAGTSYYDKVDGLARWFGMNLAAAFFASLERCSCVNLNTADDDDYDNEAEVNDRPLMLTTSSSFAIKQEVGVKNSATAVENLPV